MNVNVHEGGPVASGARYSLAKLALPLLYTLYSRARSTDVRSGAGGRVLKSDKHTMRRHCCTLPQYGGSAPWQHFVVRMRSAACRLPKMRCAKFNLLGLTFAHP